jgi:hypothetical protein
VTELHASINVRRGCAEANPSHFAAAPAEQQHHHADRCRTTSNQHGCSTPHPGIAWLRNTARCPSCTWCSVPLHAWPGTALRTWCMHGATTDHCSTHARVDRCECIQRAGVSVATIAHFSPRCTSSRWHGHTAVEVPNWREGLTEGVLIEGSKHHHALSNTSHASQRPPLHPCTIASHDSPLSTIRGYRTTACTIPACLMLQVLALVLMLAPLSLKHNTKSVAHCASRFACLFATQMSRGSELNVNRYQCHTKGVVSSAPSGLPGQSVQKFSALRLQTQTKTNSGRLVQATYL